MHRRWHRVGFAASLACALGWLLTACPGARDLPPRAQEEPKPEDKKPDVPFCGNPAEIHLITTPDRPGMDETGNSYRDDCFILAAPHRSRGSSFCEDRRL